MLHLRYLKSILINNPVKIGYILLVVVPFFLFMKEKNVYVDKKNYLVNKFEFERDNSFYYVVDNIGNSESTRYSVERYDSKQDISKGYYMTKERRVIYYFELASMILFSILFLITHLFILFENERDFKWMVDRNGYHIKRSIYRDLIKCELDDGVYYYTIKKRLIYQSNSDASGSSGLYSNLDSFIKNEDLYPIFETKREKRKALLDKVLK